MCRWSCRSDPGRGPQQPPPAPAAPASLFRSEHERRIHELDKELWQLRQDEFLQAAKCEDMAHDLLLLEAKEASWDRELARVKAKVLQLT